MMELTGKTLEEFIQSEKTVMVEFWGSWCPPCQRMKDVLEDLEEEFDGQISVGKCNIDRNPSVSKKFDVLGVPSYLIFHDGEVVHRSVGAKSKRQLYDMVQNVMQNEKE